MAEQINRAKLEEAINGIDRALAHLSLMHWDDAIQTLRKFDWESVKGAAEAYAATLPKTKMVEVALVARMSMDGKAIYYCQPDTPENRHEAGSYVIQFGGQLVTLKGVAEVPA